MRRLLLAAAVVASAYAVAPAATACDLQHCVPAVCDRVSCQRPIIIGCYDVAGARACV